MCHITKESDSGSVALVRIPIDLTIHVTSTDFNVGSRQLHIVDKVAVESEHIKLESYYILNLEL
jgi:protein pelota